ncbi:hypothetical protein AB0J21_15235 [Streptomyces sp. NPDC049954]|uniref:hypothetical protein n=1 Tax=Streptomyces sp. NPDC049954 TaxID=3155779 RepID=UPI0034353293
MKPPAGTRTAEAGTRTADKKVATGRTTREEQKEKLRGALRTHPADRRGYIEVAPEDHPATSRPDRLGGGPARAEAAGNQGSWRFKETVIEKVPHD